MRGNEHWQYCRGAPTLGARRDGDHLFRLMTHALRGSHSAVIGGPGLRRISRVEKWVSRHHRPRQRRGAPPCGGAHEIRSKRNSIDVKGHPVAVYEMRTYTLYVGKMPEATRLYQELGFPALERGGQASKLIGYFQGDTGMINPRVHLWKFDDDADRRRHWAAVFANKDFVEGFASKFRPLVMSQEVKLLTPAPWGPHP
jgi:hypothetical protein